MKMIYLAYIYGWASGEPYNKMLGVYSTREKAERAIKQYLAKYPKDYDGEAFESDVFPEVLDSYTAKVTKDMML